MNLVDIKVLNQGVITRTDDDLHVVLSGLMEVDMIAIRIKDRATGDRAIVALPTCQVRELIDKLEAVA